MKKLSYIISGIALLLVLFISFTTRDTSNDYSIISGKITNPQQEELLIISIPNEVKQGNKKRVIGRIKVAPDGTFRDTIAINEGRTTVYVYNHLDSKMKNPDGTFRKNVHGVYLYTRKGDKVTLECDAMDFNNTLKVTGIESGYSVYLFKKELLKDKYFDKENKIYSNNDAESFKTVIAELREKNKKLLNASDIKIDWLKDQEMRQIDYDYLFALNGFESRHAHAISNEDYKMPDNYAAELDDLNVSIGIDFKDSDLYRRLIYQFAERATVKLRKKEGYTKEIAMLKVLGSFKNEKIKDFYLSSNARFGISKTSDIDGFYKEFQKWSTNEKTNKLIAEMYSKLRVLAVGSPSPKFQDYENYAGGNTSLDDLKGKYVYIDVWATWCGPCKSEIPHLEKIEKQYHGKNIHFVSISIDKRKDRDKWIKMVKDKSLTGIQLMADKDFKSEFVLDYSIKGIPRFILLDPEGNIVSADAPRPSDSKLVELFDEFGI